LNVPDKVTLISTFAVNAAAKMTVPVTFVLTS